jgi:MFS family permease
MMLSLCKEYWHFMLAQGILMGSMMGLLQFPAFAAVTQFFDKKRAAALGAVVSGSSIGGVVFPIAFSKMLNNTGLGFAWSIRIMAFTITPLMIIACFAVTARIPPRKTKVFLPSAFKNKTYVLIIAGMFLLFIGMFAPLFFIPTYAVSRGMSPTLSGYMLAILNAASTFGRIVPGILADKYGRLNMFAAGGISSGITILCLNLPTTNAGIIVYSVVVGFTTGTIISSASAALTVCCTNPQDMGTFMGMGIGLASIAALIGPPVHGALVQQHGGFAEVSIFAGVLCLVGGLIAFGSKATTEKGLWGNI